MRILIVSEDVPSPSMGGLAKHALNLARALVQAGHTVDFLGGKDHPIDAAGEEGNFGGRFFGELDGQDLGWKESQLGMYLPQRRSWVARRFANLIMRRAPDYDVVHYHGHVPNVARLIPAHINFVQTRHDQGGDCLINSRFRQDEVCRSTQARDCAGCRAAQPNALQRTISAAAVRRYRKEVAQSFRTHKTVFVSDMLQKNFSRTMGEDNWGVTIHNFTNTQRLAEARQRASLEPAYPADECHVFMAGKLYPEKGIEAFLETITKGLPVGMHLTIAGNGPDEERLQAKFAHPQIHFLGWCPGDETLRHAARAHAIIVPSVWEEPCATTIFEGLLLAKPTFALARGGTPELGIYAAPGQLRLHETMQSLVDDLVSFDRTSVYPPPPPGLGSVDTIVQQLLALYRLPPGYTLHEDKVNHASHPLNHHLYVE